MVFLLSSSAAIEFTNLHKQLLKARKLDFIKASSVQPVMFKLDSVFMDGAAHMQNVISQAVQFS